MSVATVIALQRFDPDEMAFLVKPLLIQIGSIVLFPTFVAWAVLMRRQPLWHKRLMALATMGLVQAAVDRMQWIPEILPMFWDNGVRRYVLLLQDRFVAGARRPRTESLRRNAGIAGGDRNAGLVRASARFRWRAETQRPLAQRPTSAGKPAPPTSR